MSYPGNRRPSRPQASRPQSVKGFADAPTEFDQLAERAFPAEVHMISGCHDSQTSADVYNVNSQFTLPNPQGRAGGACTAALLTTLYDAHRNGTFSTMTWVSLLRTMRHHLLQKGMLGYT